MLTNLLFATFALAYSHNFTVATQDFHCKLTDSRGRLLEATLEHYLYENRDTHLRGRVLNLEIGNDPEHFEQWGTKLQQLLGPTFGAPTFDESVISFTLENLIDQPSGTELGALPTTRQAMRTAWSADSQDDLAVRVQLVPRSDSAADLGVVFEKDQRTVSFGGECRLAQ